MDLIHAIDKFIAEANNFENVPVEHDVTHQRIYVPRMVAEVQWTCNRGHIIDKWHEACNSSNDPSAYYIRFYCYMDTRNKELMLQWILDHSEHNYI